MSFAIKIVPDVLRSVAFGAIGAGYIPLGGVFLHPMRIVSIKNLTDQNLFISIDGVNDNEVVPSESGIIYDFCTNRVSEAGAFIATGTQLYVRDTGVAPTSGSVYVTCFYGFGE